MEVKMGSFQKWVDKMLNEEVISEAGPQHEFSDANDFATKLGNEIKSLFPKSKVISKVQNILGDVIYVYFTLGADKDEYQNGIDMNDPALHKLIINGVDKDGKLSEKLELRIAQGGRIYDKDHTSIKTGFTNKKGTPSQIFNHIVSGFKKTKDVLKQNIDKISNSEILKKNIE